MNSKYTIIEDCSPYYIRFTYDGLTEFMDHARDVYNQQDWSGVTGGPVHQLKFCRLSPEIGSEMLAQIPFAADIEFKPFRVAFFVTAPGEYYRPHIDGEPVGDQLSVNFGIQVLDSKCVTSWYNEDDLKQYKKYANKNLAVEILDFDKQNTAPAKSFIAQQNECILFNTNIFHDWDNSQSTNERIMLTLRTVDKSITFDDAKKIIFG